MFIMIMISSNFIFNFTNFCVILFSTEVRAGAPAKLVIFGILF